jgi:hypothetical protein
MVAAAPPPSKPEYLLVVSDDPYAMYFMHAINGAGFDDSTSPPTLVLCLRERRRNIVFAKPGDTHWTLVNGGQASHPMHDDRDGKIMFYSLLSLRGRCYISSPEGSIYRVKLSPLPRLVEVVDQRRFAEPDNILAQRICSFLVGSGSGRMLMLRIWKGLEHFAGAGTYNRKEIFTAGGITRRVEVLEVDMTGRRLVPVRSLGRHAAFLGLTHCMLISTEIFPSIDAVLYTSALLISNIGRGSASIISTARKATGGPNLRTSSDTIILSRVSFLLPGPATLTSISYAMLTAPTARVVRVSIT